MADEYKISFVTDADLSGTKRTEEGRDRVAKATREVEKAADEAANASRSAEDRIESLGEAGESSEQGLQSTTDLLGALAMAMRGDLIGAATQAGGAIEMLSQALSGGPWGIATVAIGAVAAAFTLFAGEAEDAAESADDLESALLKLSPKAREMAGKMIELAQAAAEQNQKLAEAKTPAEQLAESFSKATAEAERYKAVRDSMASQAAAIAIADTNLAEVQGRLTAKQAEAARAAIEHSEKIRKASTSEIAAAYEKFRALNSLYEADSAKRNADIDEYKARKEFEGMGGQLPISPGILADQIQRADQKVKEAEKEQYVSDGTGLFGVDYQQFQEEKVRRIALAKKELEDIQALAAAYEKLTRAQEKADAAESSRKATASSANQIIDRANLTIKEQQTQRNVAALEAQKKQQEASNQQQKENEEASKKAAGEATARQKKAIGVQKLSIENQITALEQSLSGKEEDTAEFKQKLAEIAAKKKQLIDLDDAINALDGELNDAAKTASQLKKRGIDQQAEAQIESAQERRAKREEMEGRERMSPLSARPQSNRRERDQSGHLVRRGKIISRQPARDQEDEGTDFDDALRPGQIDTRPGRINTRPGRIDTRQRRNGAPQNGTGQDGLDNAAKGTQAAADTHDRAAHTYAQSAAKFETAATQMASNASQTEKAVQQLVSVLQSQGSKLAILTGIVNRLNSTQGGSGS